MFYSDYFNKDLNLKPVSEYYWSVVDALLTLVRSKVKVHIKNFNLAGVLATMPGSYFRLYKTVLLDWEETFKRKTESHYNVNLTS